MQTGPTAPRPYKLTPAEAGEAHAAPWNDAAIARFVVHVALLMRRGFSATDADDLAERLHLRDVLACLHAHPASRIDELLPHRC